MASRAQSVVRAVAGLSDNELKNLGLTAEQRTAARRALGRGETAPASEVTLSVPRLAPADRVVWRDIQDVKKDIGLDALPAHITPFADFMGVMADKAGVGMLSPRDLIKAYTITRSSVNRAAVATWRATGAGLQLPDSHTDETVRPEGAFAYWLGFYAQTGGNFRTPLILMESLHQSDFLGETSKSSADRWSKSRSHMDGRSHDTKK